MITCFRRPYQRGFTVALVGTMVTLLVTACGESKVTQCNKLIAVINQGEEIDQRFEEETQILASFEEIEEFEEFKAAAQEMSNAFGAIADEVDTYLEAVNALELSDEALVAYQEAYAQQGQDFNRLIRDTSELFGKVNTLDVSPNDNLTPENAQQVMALASSFEELDFQVSVEESGRETNAVISDINTYCGLTSETESVGGGGE